MSELKPHKPRLLRSTAWHPWQPEELTSSAATALDSDPACSTSVEAEQPSIYEQAWRQGYQQGERQGREDGRQSGYAEGYEQGLAEGRAKAQEDAEQALREAIQPLAELLAQADAAMDGMKRDIAADLVDLGVAAGQQLARHTLDEAPELIGLLIRELLRLDQAPRQQARLQLHPDDAALVAAKLGPELERANWELQADDNLSRGGCRLISPYGELDATWEARCAQVWGQIRRRHQNAAPTAPGSQGDADR